MAANGDFVYAIICMLSSGVVMEFTDTVLILRVGRFREADLWVRFLSPQRGLLSAFAFGGSRSRRRFSGCLDVFNEVNFSFKETRGGVYTVLQEGVLVRAPQKLREDWQRLGMAANCAKFVEAFGISPDTAPSAHALLTDVLSVLEEDAIPPPTFPLFFRARVAFEQGYAMQLKICMRCGISLLDCPETFFLIREGHFLCTTCARTENSGKTLRVRKESLDALSHVQDYSPLRWREGTFAVLPAAVHRECAKVVDAFIEHHVGLQWNSNRFIRV